MQITADANRRVIVQFAAAISQIFMSQMGPGGMITPDTVSDLTYTVPIIVKGKDASCKVREDLRVAYLNKQEGENSLAEEAFCLKNKKRRKRRMKNWVILTRRQKTLGFLKYHQHICTAILLS